MIDPTTTGKTEPCDCGRHANGIGRRCALCTVDAERLTAIREELTADEREMSFESTKTTKLNAKAVDAARQIATNLRAESTRQRLVLSGPFGSGKTHLARAIWHDLVFPAQPWKTLWRRCCWIREMDWFEAQRRAMQPDSQISRYHLLQTAQRAPILFWDDLGRQARGGDRSWADTLLYLVFDARYSNRLATIVTTNIDLSKPSPDIDDAVRDRINAGAIRIALKSESWRETVGQ